MPHKQVTITQGFLLLWKTPKPKQMIEVTEDLMEYPCDCWESHNARLQKVRRKYDNLRKKYKKLLGVAIELTQVLEEYVRGQRTPNVTESLVLCSKIYPSLFKELSARNKEINFEESRKHSFCINKETVVEEMEEGETANAEKEYMEGFSSRPRLPRTPLNQSR